MRRLLSLVFCVTALSGCVTIPNTRSCQVAGVLNAGMICAESLTDHTSDMTLSQAIDFLEPQAERPDPENPGKTLPARAGAICRSADDESKLKTALEEACRELGSRCSYEIQQTILSIANQTKAVSK